MRSRAGTCAASAALSCLERQGRGVRRAHDHLGVAARLGLAVGRQLCRVLCTFVRVDGARQRQAVIPLVDGLVRLLQRRGRCGESIGGVLFGAGRPGGVDSTLCAIDFFVGGFGAPCGEQDA